MPVLIEVLVMTSHDTLFDALRRASAGSSTCVTLAAFLFNSIMSELPENL